MLPELNFTTLCPALLNLAEEAGRALYAFYQQQDIQVLKKKDGSPVTPADQTSHHILAKGLEILTPSVPVISEEDPSSWDIKSSLFWLIDPLDGTHEFIRKGNEFCINIALIKDRHPIFGLIHLPCAKDTYYGYQKTAWKSKEGTALPITTRTFSPEGLNLLLGNHTQEEEVFMQKEETFLQKYPVAHVQRVSSAIKFCYVASGRGDLYLRLKPCAEWDTGAGQALIEAAGGTMTTLNGEPLLYGKKDLMSEAFIACGKRNDSLTNP